jgi:hypothetical protein
VPKPFDATTKHLLEAEPADWLAFLGLPTGTGAHVIDADLATVTADADRVVSVGGPAPYLAHIEFQASYDAEMPLRLLRYNVLLRYRHGLPVQSAVVLLRRQADGPGLTGLLEYARSGAQPGKELALTFRYDVERIWRRPVAALLAGGLGVLPLAPLSDVAPTDLPGAIRRMEERIRVEATPEEAGILWTARPTSSWD